MKPRSAGAQVPLPAGLTRRFASLAYEVLLVLALSFFAGFAFQGASASLLEGVSRHLFRAYLFLVIGLYFIPCWIRGGQTLPMKAWGLKLVSKHGAPVTAAGATARYLIAWVSLSMLGLGFLWAEWDSERQFLHDRLAGTRIVRI